MKDNELIVWLVEFTKDYEQMRLIGQKKRRDMMKNVGLNRTYHCVCVYDLLDVGDSLYINTGSRTLSSVLIGYQKNRAEL